MLKTLCKYFTTKRQISCILFFTYIYDLVRNGFIESRKRQLEILRAMTNCGDNRNELARSMTTTLRSRDLRNTYLARHYWAHESYKLGSFISSNIKTGNNIPPPYPAVFMRQLKTSWEDLPTWAPHELDWPLDPFYSARLGPPPSPPLEALQHRRFWSDNKPRSSSPAANHTEPSKKTLTNCINEDSQLTERMKELEKDCPLEEMPRFVRRYQYLSHFLVTCSFIKYSFLVIFHNELFGSKQSYSCYIPGRTAILPRYSPFFSFLVLFYHVVYRLYLCIIRKSFLLDSFIFLLYDEQTIKSMQTEQVNKLSKINARNGGGGNGNNINDDSFEANMIYAMNKLFFIRVRLRDEPNKVIYRIKTNRNLNHWLRLKRFTNHFALFCLGNLAIWSIPLGMAIVSTVLSAENFGIIYGVCDAMIYTNRNNWSLLDLRQLIWFICDLIDSAWLLFDTANALVWPFASMVFCAQDLNYTIDELNESLGQITSRLKRALELIALNYWSKRVEFSRSRQMDKLLKTLEIDIQALQSEITRMLQQIQQVDEFMSKLTAFCIFVWIITNLFVQIIALNQNQLVTVDVVVQFMQMTALLALTLSFAYIAQVNTKTRRLYAGICNLVALDPNHTTTKSSWLWVLEYFNKAKPNYSFRLGPFTELTLANYIKACSWLITGAIVTINLYKHKYNILD